MKKPRFDGIFCLPVTPFKNDEVDEEGLRKVVEVIVRDGADGLVPTGATGEFPYLLHDERKKVWEITLDVANGKIPVTAGTGALSTKESIQFTQEALDVGCDGVLLSHPMLLPSSDEETYGHFAAVASRVDIPIILYNNPAFGRTMSPSVVERLAEEFDNVVSYKEDDFFHLRFAEIIRKNRKNITLFTGSPSAYLSFLTHGGHGALIAEFQSFPHLMKGVKESYEKGDHEKALYYHERIVEMFNVINKYFVGASFWGRYKAIWRLRGLDIEYDVRAPCSPVRPEQLEKAKPEFMKLDVTDSWYV
ncbi:dihydrodipicolinate synthase family protein [Candidatus Bathyarchaeota archaeon]|nr:dihydrodipicolinate synthase family protein [Candidatus Bathyarchaeota archaeon]